MSTWTKCSDALPPIGKPVIVAWDGTSPCGWKDVDHSAVMRDDLVKVFEDDPEWGWFYMDTQEPCDWDDDQHPTHWMPWPEFKS